MGSTRRLVATLVAASLVLLSVPLAVAAATTSPTPGVNPDLDASCGTDVTIVLDRSGSIGSDNTKVQEAAQAFVDALIGTGSEVQVVSFSTRATAEPGSSASLSDLAFRDPSTLTIPTFSSSGSTNWDDGLEMVRRSPSGHAPLTVVITDGDPTRRLEGQPDGHGGDLAGDGGTPTQADLNAAVVEANAIKLLPSHLFVVGVGSAVSNATSQGRIEAISGPDELTFAGDTPNIDFGVADYTLVEEFAALRTTVARFVRELCGPSLNVVKKLQLADGTTVSASDADGTFTFDASLAPTPSAWTAPSQPAAASASLATTDGVANFAWDPATPSSPTVITLGEQPRTGWVYNGQRCWLNNLDGTPATLVVDDVGTNTIGSSKPATGHVLPAVGPYQAMNCEVFNRQVRTASVSVDKVTVPGGLPDAFSFALRRGGDTVDTLASITDATPATAFDPVNPGTYDVVEGDAAHYTLSAATCDDLTTQPVEQQSATGLVLGEGARWQCGFTNTLHDGAVRIVKDLVGAPAGTFAFTSNLPGHPAFDLHPTATTDAVVTFPVAPGIYAVAEAAAEPYTSEVSCDNGSTADQIVVTPDVTTTCTFTNTAPTPTIEVTKSSSVGVVSEPGADVTFTVTITNASVEPLTITELTDAVGGTTIDVLGLPADRTTCGLLAQDDVAPGATVSCWFTAPVEGNAGASVTDRVDVEAQDGDGNVATDNATATVRVVDVAPTIVVSKTALTPSVPEPGGPALYSVSITNTSAEAVTVTSLTDQVGDGPQLPLNAVAGPITHTNCTLDAIEAGATTTCSFIATVTGNAGTIIGDTVRVSAVDDDGTFVHASDNASVVMTDVLPSIEVTKSAGVATVAEPGGDVTYTVGISNLTAEPVIIGSIVDVVDGGDPFPVAGSCAALVGTSLAGNGNVSCSFTLAVVGDASDGPVGDTVTVTASDDEGHSTSSAASASVGVTDVLPVITVTKSVAPTSVSEPGGTVTFTVGIANASVEPVTIDSLVDRVDGGEPIDLTTLPGSCDDLVGNELAPQASASCTFDLAVTGDGDGTVHDVVTVSAGDDDGNQATDSAAAEVAILDVLPEISVTKTASVATLPEPGGAVTYTVTVINQSVEPVTVTSLADVVGDEAPFDVTEIDGSTCALPQVLTIEGSYSCSFTVAATGNAGATVIDVVTAMARDDDDNTTSATATASVGVTDVAPTLTVSKVASGPELSAPGGLATFEVTMTNTSPEPITVSAIVDTIDEVDTDVTVVAGAVTATTCETGIELAAAGDEGDTVTCTFTLAMTSAEAATITDVVTVTAHDDEGNDATADDDASTTFAAVADLALTKEATGVPTVGQTGTYTLAVTNLGPSTATDVLVVDQLPPLLLATAASGDGWSCTIPVAATSVACARDSLGVGAAPLITIVVSVGDVGAGVSLTNTATVSSPTTDPDLTNNTDTVTVAPIRVLGNVVEAPAAASALPRTGVDVQGWIVVADLLLILGVLALLTTTRRTTSP